MQENFDIFKPSKQEEIVTIAISLLLTVVLHVIAIKMLPDKFSFEQKENEQMAFEILPPKIEHKIPDFVEANPYGNELKPKNDAPVSFKSQRVADEIPEKNSTSTRPFVKGEDKKYKKIVSGTNDNLDKLDPSRVNRVLERPLTAHTKESVNSLQKPKLQHQESQQKLQLQSVQASETKIKLTEKSHLKRTSNSSTKNIATPDKIDAVISSNAMNSITVPKVEDVQKKSTTNSSKKTKDSSEKKEPTQQQKIAQQQTSVMPSATDIPKPKARPRLSMKIPAGPLMDNNRASSNTGLVSVDSKFSEFGAYQQRMIEAISRQWNLLGSKYDLSSEYGSFVIIEYSINTNGELVNFRIVTSTSSNIGCGLCQQAILTTAPYGVWTQEMVNTLGQQPQQVRIQFNYR